MSVFGQQIIQRKIKAQSSPEYLQKRAKLILLATLLDGFTPAERNAVKSSCNSLVELATTLEEDIKSSEDFLNNIKAHKDVEDIVEVTMASLDGSSLRLAEITQETKWHEAVKFLLESTTTPRMRQNA